MIVVNPTAHEAGVFCTRETRRIQVSNPQRGTTLVHHGEIARTFWQRFMGLMGRPSLPAGYGLLFLHENWIHMFFMRIPIDVLHLDQAGRVLKILPSIRPWRVGPLVRQSAYVLELPAGTASSTGTTEGDWLRIAEQS